MARYRMKQRWFSFGDDFSLTDTYGIEVAEGEDDLLVLCVAIVIDLCCHQDRK